MAEVNVRNILVGYGDLYWAYHNEDGSSAVVDATFFDAVTDSLRDAFDDSADWFYAGATQEGVELGYSPEYGEVEIDQMKDAAIMFNQSVGVTLNTNLAEATLTNLLLAWGVDEAQLEGTETETFSIGVPDEDPVERSVAVVGKGSPVDVEGTLTPRDRVYVGRRVLSIEGSTFAMRRTEATVFPVSFRLLPDPEYGPNHATQPRSEYGQIIDRIPAPATP
jgi:hypothetical protein